MHHSAFCIIGKVYGRTAGVTSTNQQIAVVVKKGAASQAIKNGKTAPLGIKAVFDAGGCCINISIFFMGQCVCSAQQMFKTVFSRAKENLGVTVFHGDDCPVELYGK